MIIAGILAEHRCQKKVDTTRTRHDYTLATAVVALSTYVATCCIPHLTNSTHHLDTRFSFSNFERPVLGHIKSAVSKPILAIKYLMGNSLGENDESTITTAFPIFSIFTRS